MHVSKKSLIVAISTASLTLAFGTAQARTLSVELTNMTHGMFFTPRLATAHDAEYHILQVGQPASEGLRTMAETGNPMVLAGEVPASAVFAVDASGDSPTVADGIPRILMPGSTSTVTLEDVPDNDVFLSLGAMLMPTNDAVVGLDAFPVPAGLGTYEIYLNAYDTGTEANTELVLPEALRSFPECSSNDDEGSANCNNGSFVPFHPDAAQSGFFSVGFSGTGVVEPGSAELSVVHIHRGVVGDFSDQGGNSDLSATFHRWLNPVGRIVLTVSE